MSIKYGDKSIKKVYMGDKEIKSAYMGDKLVYKNEEDLREFVYLVENNKFVKKYEDNTPLPLVNERIKYFGIIPEKFFCSINDVLSSTEIPLMDGSFSGDEANNLIPSTTFSTSPNGWHKFIHQGKTLYWYSKPVLRLRPGLLYQYSNNRGVLSHYNINGNYLSDDNPYIINIKGKQFKIKTIDEKNPNLAYKVDWVKEKNAHVRSQITDFILSFQNTSFNGEQEVMNDFKNVTKFDSKFNLGPYHLCIWADKPYEVSYYLYQSSKNNGTWMNWYMYAVYIAYRNGTFNLYTSTSIPLSSYSSNRYLWRPLLEQID